VPAALPAAAKLCLHGCASQALQQEIDRFEAPVQLIANPGRIGVVDFGREIPPLAFEQFDEER
jgi:hypothetical protein